MIQTVSPTTRMAILHISQVKGSNTKLHFYYNALLLAELAMPLASISFMYNIGSPQSHQFIHSNVSPHYFLTGRTVHQNHERYKRTLNQDHNYAPKGI